MIAPLVVLTHAQIVDRYRLDAETFNILLERLKGKERRLTSGKPGYFVSDVEAVLKEIWRV